MSFDQSTITSIAQPQYQGSQVYISWSSSAGSGAWYQVYAGGLLSWWGQATSCWLPAPSIVERVEIGTVNPGEERTSFSSSLPAAPLRTVTLAWLGGTYEDQDLAGFKIYGEPAAGAGISYTTPLATITAYPAGFVMDGYGLGGYGNGGYGQPGRIHGRRRR
jgi:hypothetical protein